MTRRTRLQSLGGSLLSATQSERPNFIIIFADDLGYGDLGAYGFPEYPHSAHQWHGQGRHADDQLLSATRIAIPSYTAKKLHSPKC
jgi:arylsulfatase A-like enzyme